MEDFHETRVDGVDGETVGLFGVFDGKMQPIPDRKFMTPRKTFRCSQCKQASDL